MQKMVEKEIHLEMQKKLVLHNTRYFICVKSIMYPVKNQKRKIIQKITEHNNRQRESN
jgi:hypothetical protein